jgi:DNA (cytosine-5)-methyltransferase 1
MPHGLTFPSATSATRLSGLVAEGQHVLTSIEICAGAGGQALGLETAGFEHLACVEIDPWAAETLRRNRPHWRIIGPKLGRDSRGDDVSGDVREFHAYEWADSVDLLAGGVPCPPFSVAGKQLGGEDERDLFPEALRLVQECRPRAVMLENVRGLLDPKFSDYRIAVESRLRGLGYEPRWRLLNASDFGVPQLRPRTVLVALEPDAAERFRWPNGDVSRTATVGEVLYDLMAANQWEGADAWRERARRIAPTLVGGSKKHGGPDLGPTRAKRAWAALGVDGLGIADSAPRRGFDGMPRLTVRMAARLQGFEDEWQFAGRKTASYRQVGNAFPPPVACAVGTEIARALGATTRSIGLAA